MHGLQETLQPQNYDQPFSHSMLIYSFFHVFYLNYNNAKKLKQIKYKNSNKIIAEI